MQLAVVAFVVRVHSASIVDTYSIRVGALIQVALIYHMHTALCRPKNKNKYSASKAELISTQVGNVYMRTGEVSFV